MGLLLFFLFFSLVSQACSVSKGEKKKKNGMEHTSFDLLKCNYCRTR